ncbi:hypothetical protein VP1G_07510 [Cytospora mali]|uniref:Uncharacterized protein n=1 Tax=Cytospora mali TaxID=578113 RepID=A0A194V8E9_CYTMA|nr:hypothetical protein VP1G_07510 [Valsa mali var. pyri (nom. inval.)]
MSPPSLPQVPGPKLAPFTPTAYAEINFMKPLGSSKDQEGHVWKVKINGRDYALKMVTQYLARRLAKPQLYIDYFDPFNCECRVYGRLKQEKCEDLAVRCHGYLLLTPKQEVEITKKIAGKDYELDSTEKLEGWNLWDRYEQHRGQPIRAIVKELIDDGKGYGAKPFEAAQIPRLWGDPERLQSLGILVRDIHIGNYFAREDR